MKFIPYDKFRMTSHLPRQVIDEKLNRDIEPWQIFRFFGESKPYEGWYKNDVFKVSSILIRAKLYNPLIVGKISPTYGNETMIRLTMKLKWYQYIVSSAILGFVIYYSYSVLVVEGSKTVFAYASIAIAPLVYGVWIYDFNKLCNEAKSYFLKCFEGEEIKSAL